MCCESHRHFLQFTAGDSERSQQRPARSAAPSHNSRQGLSSVARSSRRVRLSSVSPSNSNSNRNSSSLRRVGLCSGVPRLNSLRVGDRLEVPSSLRSQLADCLEALRPSSSLVKADLCSGVPRLNQLRVAESLAHNSPFNNSSREGRFLAPRNNNLSSREPLSLEAPNNLPPDRRRHCLGRHNSSLPPGHHCLAAPSNHQLDPPYSAVGNPNYLVLLPPRPSPNSNPLWERRSVRSL